MQEKFPKMIRQFSERDWMKRDMAETDFYAAVAHGAHFPDGIEISGSLNVFFGFRFVIQSFRDVNDIAEKQLAGTIVMRDQQTLVFGRVTGSWNAENGTVAENIELAVDIDKAVSEFFRHRFRLFPDNDLDIRKIFEPIDMIAVSMGEDDVTEITGRDIHCFQFADSGFFR